MLDQNSHLNTFDGLHQQQHQKNMMISDEHTNNYEYVNTFDERNHTFIGNYDGNPGSKLQKIQKFSKYLNQNESQKFIGGYGYRKGHKKEKVTLDIKLEKKMPQIPYFEQEIAEYEEQCIVPNNMVKVLYPKNEETVYNCKNQTNLSS